MKNYIPEITYGGLDGLVTTFGILSSGLILGIDTKLLFILGLASVMADGFSMASSSYLSEKNRKKPKNPLHVAMNTFLSFVLLGSILLIPFVYKLYINPVYEITIQQILLLFGVLLLFIGQLRPNKIKGMKETFIIGLFVALIVYIVSINFN